MENKNITVVIPAYEPPLKFVDYLKELIKGGANNVIVVNDVSEAKYQKRFDILLQIRR